MPPSFEFNPLINGTLLNCLRETSLAGSAGKNGSSRSESIRGPNAIGYKPKAFKILDKKQLHILYAPVGQQINIKSLTNGIAIFFLVSSMSIALFFLKHSSNLREGEVGQFK